MKNKMKERGEFVPSVHRPEHEKMVKSFISEKSKVLAEKSIVRR